MTAVRIAGIVAGGVLLATLGPAGAVSFTFSQIAGDTLTTEQSAAFGVAAAAWSAVLADPVEVKLSIGFRDLGANSGGAFFLGTTRPSFVTASYRGFGIELSEDAKGGTDAMAVAALPPVGPSSAVLMTSGQARATGFATGVEADGSIEFTSNSGVSFAPTRAAMTPGTYDLIGVAAHEIGHVLGFVSSVDIGTSTRSALDLFRYAGSGAPGFAAGQGAYFSLDFGATSLGSFAVGGAGQQQASHWLQGTGALMDPAVATGVVKDITARDAMALDVVGWDMVVPEPPSGALVLAGLGLLGFWRRVT